MEIADRKAKAEHAAAPGTPRAERGLHRKEAEWIRTRAVRGTG
jgi:hypothetical protein